MGGGWAFTSTYVVDSKYLGTTYSSVPDGTPAGTVPAGTVKTYTSGTIPCFIPGVGHVVNWTGYDGGAPAGSGSISITIGAGC